MSKFSAAANLRLFSTAYGELLALPGSGLSVRAYPRKIRVYQGEALMGEQDIVAEGPSKRFAAFLDADRACIEVHADGQIFYVQAEGASYTISQHKKSLRAATSGERLSLGNHKKADLTLLRRRMDTTEIVPFWLRLAALRKESFELDPVLAPLVHAKALKEHDKISGHLIAIFKQYFTGGFVQRLADTDFLGYEPANAISNCSVLLGGAQIIRSLLIEEMPGVLSILPHLPPEWHAGRFLNVATAFGLVHIEWSKKSVRSVQIVPKEDGSVRLFFASATSFKVGKQVMLNGATIELKQNQPVTLHQFKNA